jgi:glutathione S-transferase
MLLLHIGNKNYSSWSMRAWVLMRQAGIDFEERPVRFDGFDAGSEFKRALDALGAAGKVLVLVLDDGLAVWDTLAIAETLAERFPGRRLWPADAARRARARSLCAEMHAGFQALRGHCPMNIEADLRATGARLWQEQPALRDDVARLEAAWAEPLRAHGGPMLFGDFGIADAFFAPVCMRLLTYGLPLATPAAAAYRDRVAALPAVREWMDDARAEHDFRPFEEPYRTAP